MKFRATKTIEADSREEAMNQISQSEPTSFQLETLSENESGTLQQNQQS